MRRSCTLVLLLATLACGRDEERPAEVAPDTAVFVRDTHTYIDSATGVELISPQAAPAEGEFQPVELPMEFPNDFPIPDGAIVIEATSQPIPSGGHYATVTIVEKREERSLYDWYREELGRNGWQVSEAVVAQPLRIEAVKGKGRANMVIQPHPEYPASGWTRIVAFVQG